MHTIGEERGLFSLSSLAVSFVTGVLQVSSAMHQVNVSQQITSDYKVACVFGGREKHSG